MNTSSSRRLLSGFRGRLILTVCVLLLAGTGAAYTFGPALVLGDYEPQEGDILFQSLPHMALVDAIEGTTESPFSHCGIVAKENGRWVVYEALGDVRPVPLTKFLIRGREWHFAAYRLTSEHQRHVAPTLAEVRKMVGRPYDLRYRMDDESIYCSELVYKAYLAATGTPLGKLVRVGDLNWKPYESVITQIEGGPVPLQREMITPRDLARASQLHLVASRGFDSRDLGAAKHAASAASATEPR